MSTELANFNEGKFNIIASYVLSKPSQNRYYAVEYILPCRIIPNHSEVFFFFGNTVFSNYKHQTIVKI
jgi:hypothetical protein